MAQLQYDSESGIQLYQDPATIDMVYVSVSKDAFKFLNDFMSMNIFSGIVVGQGWYIKANLFPKVSSFFNHLSVQRNDIYDKGPSESIRQQVGGTTNGLVRHQEPTRTVGFTYVHVLTLVEMQLLFSLYDMTTLSTESRTVLEEFMRLKLKDDTGVYNTFDHANLDDIIEQNMLPTIGEYLQKRKMVRGDIVACQFIGYRNDGLFIYDGTNVIPLEREPDEYGNVPHSFKVITEFPIMYWSNAIGHNNVVWIDRTQLTLSEPIMDGTLPTGLDVQTIIYDNYGNGAQFGYCTSKYNGITYTIITMSESDNVTTEQASLVGVDFDVTSFECCNDTTVMRIL